MEADTNSSGLNDNSESGECDSLRSDGAVDMNSNNSNTLDYDSNVTKPSSRLERTNIDALDDSARDTLIVPPHDDSSHSGKSSKKGSLEELRKEEQEILDFGDNDDEEDGALSDDDEEDGETEPPTKGDEEEGEIDEEENKNQDLDDTGEVLSEDEGEIQPVSKNPISLKNDKDEGEADDDNELEEGEVSDDDDRAKDPKPICRFFGKGQCTWGSNCRFLHPGVTDKGLYTMFDSMRPIVPIQPPPSMSPGGSKAGLLGVAPPNFVPMIKPDEPLIESAWERGLRHAKEIIKQSVKRKETDVDFEEKKMNLSLAQEDIDKENDFYMRKPGSPLERKANNSGNEEEFEDFVRERDEERERGRDWNPPRPSHHPPAAISGEIDPDFVRERVHRIKPSRVREAPPRDPHPPMREAPPLHEPEVRMVRESALRRGYNPPPPSFQSHGHSSRRSNYDDPRKAEEWHDPWVRTKSPGSRGRKDSSLSKRSSYSSGSSRSSSFSSDSSKSSKSSRSSSKSSKSSRGSKSPTSKNKTRKKKEREPEVIRKAPPRRSSPKPMRIAPPPPPKEEFGRRGDQRDHHYERGERPMRYAPPAPKESNYPRDRDIRMDKDPYMRDRNMDVKRGRGRGGGGGRNQRPRNSWSGRSSSRSRSHSRSTWSQSPSKSRSRSPGGKTSKVRSKFPRDKSTSRSRSFRKASSSRSHSRSSTSSSTSSRSYSRGGKRKRKMSNKEPREPSVEIDGPPEKLTKMDPTKISKLQEKTIKAEASKSQIKMTLKPSTGFKANKNVLDKLSDEFLVTDAEISNNKINSPKMDENSKDDFSNDEVDESSEKPGSPKDSKSSRIRREELLKQLKAVEEAIAKKRSKLEK